MTKIALGTWAWGAGAFGGDTVFGSNTDVGNLKPVFQAAMKAGLNLWDTATVYGMGESERILGALSREFKREDVQISTKFTPQIAEIFENSVEKMADASILRMDCDYIDIYWIHNPMDVERWTPGLMRQALKCLQCRTISPCFIALQRRVGCWTIAKRTA